MLDLCLPMIAVRMVIDLPLKALDSPAIIFPFSNLVNILSLTYISATVTQSQCTMEKKLNIFKCQNSMLDVDNNTEVICLRTGQSIKMKDTWKLHKILINYFTFICSIGKAKI